jgi:hypothetical protein
VRSLDQRGWLDGLLYCVMGWVKNRKSNSGLEMRYIYSIYTISDDKVEPSKYRVLPLLGFCMLLCEVQV